MADGSYCFIVKFYSTMVAASDCFRFLNVIYSFIVFLVLLTLSFPTVQPLSFNITNFSDAGSASSMVYNGYASPTNGSIKLCEINSSCIGRAIYGKPLRLWDSSTTILTDFSTRFSFTIYKDWKYTLYGDGFAFFLASPSGYKNLPKSSGKNFGLFGNINNGSIPQNHVVAVEFDTFVGYDNKNDPPRKHVGIDVDSNKSLVYSWFDIDRNIGNPCHALITYNASTKTFAVSWSFDGSVTAFSPNASLSYSIDLMKILPEWVNVGFSASTGTVSERNMIHSWEFNSALNSTNPAPQKNSTNPVVGNRGSHRLNMVAVVVPVTCSIILMLVAASVICWLIRKKRRTNVDDNDNHRHTSVEFDFDRETIPRRFKYEELVAATNGFAEYRRLGQGGSGQVYKGLLSDLGRVVAVKRIYAAFENSERVFTNEVKIISRLIHRNLVQFIGWCHEEGEMLLVFDYMPNGSLDTHLFGNKKSLAWDVRYNIAIGLATSLHYLHELAEQCVVHRDIKSANVLLDTDFSTKLGDFGIARLVDPRLRTQRTRVVGTLGYLAPEYIDEGRASKESDMYSFGVVALEIATGRRTYQDGEFHVHLKNWVWQLYVAGNILNAADEKLNGDFDINGMTCLLTVGLWCTHPSYIERPKAMEVIKFLQFEAPVPVLPHNMHDPPAHTNHGQSNYFLQSPPMITSSVLNDGR